MPPSLRCAVVTANKFGSLRSAVTLSGLKRKLRGVPRPTKTRIQQKTTGKLDSCVQLNITINSINDVMYFLCYQCDCLKSEL